MKNYIIPLVLILIQHASMAQTIPDQETMRSCITAHKVCTTGKIEDLFSVDQTGCSDSLRTYYQKFEMTGPGNITIHTNGHTGTYTLYGPMLEFNMAACQQIDLGQVNQVSGTLAGSFDIPHAMGHYVLRVTPTNCIYDNNYYKVFLNFEAPKSYCFSTKPGCKDCIGSFSPDPGKYLVSAWVKDDKSDPRFGYDNPFILVSYVGAPDNFYLKPSGAVIDGWQRIDGLVTVPSGAASIKIALSCEKGDCLFDDIRFIPTDGSMLSYVYDPITLRLIAELDERNYATLYEYDEEGKLIRTKKETEKGIMTITEGRTNIRK